VILDGTWSDPRQRQRAREVAAHSALAEFACVASLDETVARIRTRTATTSQVTPDIATALAHRDHDHGSWPEAHRIDTTRDLSESVTEVLDICVSPVERRAP
jgi:predicted kinase